MPLINPNALNEGIILLTLKASFKCGLFLIAAKYTHK